MSKEHLMRKSRTTGLLTALLCPRINQAKRYCRNSEGMLWFYGSEQCFRPQDTNPRRQDDNQGSLHIENTQSEARHGGSAHI